MLTNLCRMHTRVHKYIKTEKMKIRAVLQHQQISKNLM